MDANVFYAENKDIIMNVIQLTVVLPVLFLSIHPEYTPAMIPRQWILYAAYLVLILSAVFGVMGLVKAVQAKQAAAKAMMAMEEPTPVAATE